jgi:hypothetical protein
VQLSLVGVRVLMSGAAWMDILAYPSQKEHLERETVCYALGKERNSKRPVVSTCAVP